MTKAVDAVFSGMSEVQRGLAALGSVFLIAVSLGIAIGSMGVREDVSELRQTDERLENDISANRSAASANASRVAAIESLIQQTGLVEMSERVRRIDRELCLLRAGQTGAVTSQMQQECARR